MFYFIASDYFHVARLESFIEFWHVFPVSPLGLPIVTQAIGIGVLCFRACEMLSASFPLLILLAISVLQLDAKVLRIEISSRQDVLGRHSSGNAGPYQRIVGKIYYAAPVGNWHDTQVFDLANAVNEKDGGGAVLRGLDRDSSQGCEQGQRGYAAGSSQSRRQSDCAVWTAVTGI